MLMNVKEKGFISFIQILKIYEEIICNKRKTFNFTNQFQIFLQSGIVKRSLQRICDSQFLGKDY